jgi:hypothetical protein
MDPVVRPKLDFFNRERLPEARSSFLCDLHFLRVFALAHIEPLFGRLPNRNVAVPLAEALRFGASGSSMVLNLFSADERFFPAVGAFLEQSKTK